LEGWRVEVMLGNSIGYWGHVFSVTRDNDFIA
jgi:hypothetical protein